MTIKDVGDEDKFHLLQEVLLDSVEPFKAKLVVTFTPLQLPSRRNYLHF